MPLLTSITRNGEPLKLQWEGNDFLWVSMGIAASLDMPDPSDFPKALRADFAQQGWAYPETIGMSARSVRIFALHGYAFLAGTPLNSGSYTLKRAYTFEDITSNQTLELLSGDVLSAYRS